MSHICSTGFSPDIVKLTLIIETVAGTGVDTRALKTHQKCILKKNHQIVLIISSTFLNFFIRYSSVCLQKNASNINNYSNCAYNIGKVFDFCA